MPANCWRLTLVETPNPDIEVDEALTFELKTTIGAVQAQRPPPSRESKPNLLSSKVYQSIVF